MGKLLDTMRRSGPSFLNCAQSWYFLTSQTPAQCVAVRADESGHSVQLLERGRQTARHVKNAQQAVQQVESMSAREQREKLRPSALAALEGRERELKASCAACSILQVFSGRVSS